MQRQILNILKPFNFDQVGLVSTTTPLSLSFYSDWLEEGYHAEMSYLKDHLQQKKNLKEFLPQAKSAIVVTLNYFNHPKYKNLSPFKIASYAKGEDYHYFFKKNLEDAVSKLSKQFPSHHFKTSTDSQPILERDFAYQAGLGWFGKNTCLIHQKKGSYFLIGEIITNLDFNKKDINPNSHNSSDLNLTTIEYHPDRCGTCTKCIEACPTQALVNKKLDSSKCISYWTIESKKIPPLSLAQKFDSWFFGCDICQDVCPWNIKVHGQSKIEEKNQTDRKLILKEILTVLNSSNKSLEKKYFGTPLSRARGFGLKRNALIIALNINASEIKEELSNLDLRNQDLNTFKDLILSNLK